MNNYLYNLEYERIVLGRVLLEPNLFEVIQDLSEETFYFEYNKVIYKAMKLLDKEKSPIDLISLVNKIEQIDNTVEMMYITNLNQYAATASNIEFYIGELKEMKQKRDTVELAKNLIEGIQTGRNINTCINTFETGTKANKEVDEDNALSSIIANMFDKLGEKIERVLTGIKIVDKLTEGGLAKKELLTIGAKSGVGKSAMSLRMAINMLKQDKKVLIISREMSKEQVAERILLSYAGITRQEYRSGELSSSKTKRVIEAMENLNTDNLRIDDSISTIAQIKKALRTYKPDVLIVDYVQLLTPTDTKVPRERQVAELSRELKNITLDYNMIVIQLTQLADKGTGNYRPHGETYCRESRAIYQDSNQVVYIHEVTEEKELEQAWKRTGFNEGTRLEEFIESMRDKKEKGYTLVEVILDKNRDGDKGSRYYLFCGKELMYYPIGNK